MAASALGKFCGNHHSLFWLVQRILFAGPARTYGFVRRIVRGSVRRDSLGDSPRTIHSISRTLHYADIASTVQRCRVFFGAVCYLQKRDDYADLVRAGTGGMPAGD